MDASVDGNFSNNPIAPHVINKVFSDKLSESSIRYLYPQYGAHLAIDTVNTMVPQFVTHRISAVDAPNKGAEIWIPATRTRNFLDITNWSAADHSIGQRAAVGDTVGTKSDYIKENYKIDFVIWMENTKLQFKRKNIENS